MPKTFYSTVALQEGFLKHLGEVASSSGFSLSRFVLFFHVIPDRLDDDQITSLCGAQKCHWIITINGKKIMFGNKLICPTDTLQ